jgi:hypothetical protein
MSYKVHTNCRACGYGPPFTPDGIKSAPSTEHLESILNLGVMPLPNAFRKTNEKRPGHYPVELLACPRCGLGQLSAVVDPEVLYSNYPYVTSPSETMLKHFKALWEEVSEERPVERMVEIGSNDGLCLEVFKGYGAQNVMGIDPAENLVKLSRERGISTQCSMFNRESANTAANSVVPVDLILARHVFCHVDNWREFIDNIIVMCSKETLVCIEVPYAQDTVSSCEWDQVYAEHLSYLTIRSVKYLLEDSALRLHHIVRFPIHGGTVALLLRRNDSSFPARSSVDAFLNNERCGVDDWKRFAQRATDQITNLKLLVRDLNKEGKRVAGYGASAKSTVWINACDFTIKDIYGVYDYTPQKLYTKIPGTDIPVIHEGAFFADGADYAVVWAWNFLNEIVKRQEKWVASGGKFIVPVPEVRIL